MKSSRAPMPSPRSAVACAAALTLVGCQGGQPRPALPVSWQGSAPAPPANRSDTAALDTARRLWEQGNALLGATGDGGAPGDRTCNEEALEYFLKSVAAALRKSSMMSAALCLAGLDREDEALDMYDGLRSQLGATLTPEEKHGLERYFDPMKRAVGRVAVSANVDGAVSIDGRERGRLPLSRAFHVLPGKHVLKVTGEGRRDFEVTVGVEADGVLSVHAELQPVLSRKTVPPPDPWSARGSLGALGGPAFGTTFGGDAEHACQQNGSCRRADPPVLGTVAGLRGALDFRSGLSVEAALGHEWLWARYSRSEDACSPGAAAGSCGSYRALHRVQVQGPMISAGVAYHALLLPPLSLVGRVSGGVLFAQVRDPTEVRAGGALLAVEGSNEVLSSVLPFVAPELGAEATWGALTAGAALSLAFFPATGQRYERRIADGLNTSCPDNMSPGAGGCAGADAAVSGHPVGPFVLWSPQLFVRFTP
jgi:hypothetical protein